MKLRSYLPFKVPYRDQQGITRIIEPSGMQLYTTPVMRTAADTFGLDLMAYEDTPPEDGVFPPRDLDDGSDGILISQDDATNLATLGIRLPYVVLVSWTTLGQIFIARHLMQGQEPAGPTWLSAPTQGA
jgi:hypothetical protein